MKRADDPRLEEILIKISEKQLLARTFEPSSVCIIGYPDDSGVRLNGGRPGANMGPKSILKYFCRMTVRKTPPIFFHMMTTAKASLASKHSKAEKLVHSLLSRGVRVITWGGGHDYGFPDAAAFMNSGRGTVLNIDAHLDVRPVENNKLHSGTPFRRFVEKFGGHHLVEWGIQPQSTSLQHEDWARKNGVQILDFRSPVPALGGRVGLSVCLDAFEGIRGVSAPTMVGIPVHAGLDCIRSYAPQSPWMGLYEAAPRYDPIHEDSARLAALFSYHFIHLK